MRHPDRLLADATIARAHACAVRDLRAAPHYVVPVPSALEVAAHAHRLGVVATIDDVAARCEVLGLRLADGGEPSARPRASIPLRVVPHE